MYPDLSYLLHDLLGTEVDNAFSIIKSFGMMLGLAFLACGILLKSELRRLEVEGKISAIEGEDRSNQIKTQDVIINSVITTVLLAKLPFIIKNFGMFKADPASIIFSGKGNWLIGILVGGAYAGYMYMQQQKTKGTSPTIRMIHPHEKTVDIIFLAAISGVVGSRLFSILENLDDFFKDPLGQLFSGSGLTVYGGIILAFITVYWFVKKNGIKPIYMMDIAGMGILLGYGIGRMGCHIAGDGDWGIVASSMPDWWFLPDWIWSYNYPNNVNNDGVLMAGSDSQIFQATIGTVEEKCKAASGMRYCHELSPRVFPTPIYEIVASLLGMFLLWSIRKKIKIPGTLFCIYLIYNGIERYFIESIRVNEKYEYFGVYWSQAQYISAIFVLLGLVGLFYLFRNKTA